MDTTKENTEMSKTNLSPDWEKQSENKTGNTDLPISGGNGKKRRTTTKYVPVEDSQVRRSDRVKMVAMDLKLLDAQRLTVSLAILTHQSYHPK
jgi:hypothetical protein